jgi:hypothetical protein
MDITEVVIWAIEGVVFVLVTVLTWGIGKLARRFGDKVDQERLQQVLARLDDAVATAVKDQQHVVVADLKASRARGKLSDEEKRRFKGAALANVKLYLGQEAICALKDALGLSGGLLDRFLGSKIEAVLFDLKRAEIPASTSEPESEEVVS